MEWNNNIVIYRGTLIDNYKGVFLNRLMYFSLLIRTTIYKGHVHLFTGHNLMYFRHQYKHTRWNTLGGPHWVKIHELIYIHTECSTPSEGSFTYTLGATHYKI